MKKIMLIKRNWFERLIKQSVMRKKSKIIRDKLKDKIINDIWTLLKQKKKQKIEEKKQNERIIKDRIIRDIRTLLEQEEED